MWTLIMAFSRKYILRLICPVGLICVFLACNFSTSAGDLASNTISSVSKEFVDAGLSRVKDTADPNIINDVSVENDKTTNNNSEDNKHGSYKIFTWDFSQVGAPFVVAFTMVVACLAKIVFHLDNRLSSIFPESCLLILLGVILGVILRLAGVNEYHMDSYTFFMFLLPPIVLDAGYFMPNRAFFDNLGTILIFAIVGTLINTFLIGFSLWGFSKEGTGTIPFQLDLLHCLTFAALISAVDPLAVLAVFEDMHINEVLHIVVFGESLINDAVTVTLYHTFGTYSAIGVGHVSALDILAGIVSFPVVAVCGTVIGVVFGLLTGLLSRFTDHVRVIQPLLVFIMGYLAYLTAEIMHFSGILSCTVCAMTMKQYVEMNISTKSNTTVKYFMKMLASVCETIIFMLLGISTVNDKHQWNTPFILLTLAFCLLYRTGAVLGLSFLANRVRMVPLTGKDQMIMAYGGLRGSIAFSLAVVLDGHIFPQKSLFVTCTIVVIYFTVFVQGTTIKPVVSWLNDKRALKRKPTMNEQIHMRTVDHFMAGLEDIIGYHDHHNIREKFQYINSTFLKPVLTRKREMQHRGLSILSVLQKLQEKDVRNYLERTGSQIYCSGHLTQSNSLAGILSDDRNSFHPRANGNNFLEENCGPSIPMPDNNSSTCLDMQALEVHQSRKMRDDSRVHHILDDAMFMPRKRFNRHHRHMLPESDTRPVFHHKSRLHLRHMVSHVGLPPNSNGQPVTVKTPAFDLTKPRKNVSFADGPFNAKCDAREFDSIMAEESVENSDSDDGGIIFTAPPSETEPSVSSLVTSPAAVELSLPWKRNTGRDPVSSSFTHSLPDDNLPQLGEAPSWVNNTDYTFPAVAADDADLLNSCDMQDGLKCASADEILLFSRKEDLVPDSQIMQPDTYSLPFPWLVAEEEKTLLPETSKNSHSFPETNTFCLNECDNNSCPTFPAEQPKEYASMPWEKEEEIDVLPLPWFSNHLDCNRGDKVAPALEAFPCESDDTSLPLPWLSLSTGPEPQANEAYRTNVDVSLHTQPKSCPQFNRYHDDDMSPFDGLPPPPWRHNSDVEASLDCHAPRPSGNGHNVASIQQRSCIPPPWRQLSGSDGTEPLPLKSPSCSHEVDAFSIRPQHSQHSFRISEGESKHSEPYQMHHVIDFGHGRPAPTIDLENIRELDLDAEHQDYQERVNEWLIANEEFMTPPIVDEEEQLLDCEQEEKEQLLANEEETGF